MLRIDLEKYSIPPQAAFLALAGLGLALLVFLLGVVPAQRKACRLNARLAELSEKIETHNELYPVYASLQERLKKPVPLVGRVRESEGLSRDEVGRIMPLISELARSHGLQAVNVDPVPQSLDKESNLIAVDMLVTGDFKNFQGFINDLVALPALRHIESFQLREVFGGRQFKAKIWLELEPENSTRAAARRSFGG